MDPSDLQQALTEAQVDLERALAGVPEPLRTEPPPGGGWSARDVLEHLVIVEARVTAGIRRAWDGLDHQVLRPWDPSAVDSSKLDGLAEASHPITSPEGSRPSGEGSVPELMEALRQRRARLLALLEDIGAQDPSPAAWEHFAFGRLNVAEWILFLALHQRRHAGQLRRIAAALKEAG